MSSRAIFACSHVFLCAQKNLLPVARPFSSPVREPSNNGSSSAVFAHLNLDYDDCFFHGSCALHQIQAHVEKRLSHGLQVGFSYTFSHSTDEQSGMGLFYNGSNPLNLRSGYGLSDFDRKHVINFTYLYQLPKFFELTSLKGRFADGWAIEGLAIIQSGQPYSVIDYSGAVGSIFYGTSDGITNPIVPLTSNCSPSKAVTGASGTVPGLPALDATCFTLPLLNPGDLGGAILAGDH